MTLKQRKVAKLVGKGSGDSMKEVMIKAGYSPNTAVAPTKLTKSKGWQKLLEEMLPDDELLQAPREALKADKYLILPDEPSVLIPDHAIRLKASEQGFKLKGKFAPEQMTQFNVGEMSVQFREKTE